MNLVTLTTSGLPDQSDLVVHVVSSIMIGELMDKTISTQLQETQCPQTEILESMIVIPRSGTMCLWHIIRTDRATDLLLLHSKTWTRVCDLNVFVWYYRELRRSLRQICLYRLFVRLRNVLTLNMNITSKHIVSSLII